MRSVILFALVTLAFCSLLVFADDTYNFYFQKAPGPMTVIQGGGAQTATPANAPPQPPPEAAAAQPGAPAQAPAPAATTTAAAPKTDDRSSEYKPRYINAGATKWMSGVVAYNGLNVQAGHRFNRYIAAEIEGAFGKQSSDTYYEYGSTPSVMNIFSAGLVITPVTVQLFGWNLLEISGTGGMAYVTEVKQFSPYIGIELTLTVNPNFAISGYGRGYLRKDEVEYSGTASGTSSYDGQPYSYEYTTRYNPMPETHAGVEISMRF